MNIAIYGGSFNPPHRGHTEAAMTVARVLQPDRLLIVPDREPPHKELAENGPGPEERLALCRLAFAAVPGAEICDLELRREGKSYTADTVERLRELHPQDELTLVLGTDMLLCFELWYRFRYLLEQCSLAVLARAAGETEELERQAAHLREAYGARVEILRHEPFEVSSSELRERLPRRLGAELLDGDVYAEIIRHRWYGAQPELSWLREKAYAFLKEKRIAHVAGCEAEAVRLAMHWGEDPELAAEAGILHDIAKKYKTDEQLQLCRKYGIINNHSELESPSILHAKTGAALARDLFGAEEQVAEAIRWHCTGKADMSRLEKIIWLADYIEPGRDFPGVEEARKLAYEDLDAAMAYGLGQTLEHIRAKGGKPYQDTADAYRFYSREDA